MLRERLGTDAGNKGFVDLEVIHMKLLQVSQAGVAGAKVVDGEFDPHLVQLAEQGEGLGI